METVTVNTAPGNAISPPESADKAFETNLMNYRLSVSLTETMVFRGIISPEECKQLRTIIANKFGLSLSSIFL